MKQQSAKIFVTRRLPSQVEERMSMLFDVKLNHNDIPLGKKEIIAGCRGRNTIVSTICDQLDAKTIDDMPDEVKLIAQFGNGVDNIDIKAAQNKGITVTNTPNVLTQDTADLAMALIMSVPRRIVEGATLVARDGNWPGWSPNWMLGRRLGGKALGIIGLGRIGMAVAERAKAMGMKIHYFSRSRRPAQIEEKLDATYWPSLNEMLAEMDIISLHTPHTSETFGMLNKERLNLMKRGSFLVNVSRKELVDENALVKLIESGHLLGAGLDVFEDKDGVNPGLLALAHENKVILTPHMASSTLEGRIEMGEIVILNIQVFMDSHKPPHRVLI